MLAFVLVMFVALVVTAYFKLRQSGLLRDDSEERLAAQLTSLLPGPRSKPPPALGAFRNAPDPEDTGIPKSAQADDAEVGAVQLCAAVPPGSAIDGDRLVERLAERRGARPTCSATDSAYTLVCGRLRARVQIGPGSSMVGRLARAGALEAQERRAVLQSAAVVLVDQVSGDSSPIERARFATEVLLATLDVCSPK